MIAIVDYKAGNLTSVQLAFNALGATSEITSDPRVIERADRVVFPGVGAAGASMDNVRQMHLFDAIKGVIAGGVPFLGICVGMQILFDHSEEDGGVDCLGILPGQVRLFCAQLLRRGSFSRARRRRNALRRCHVHIDHGSGQSLGHAISFGTLGSYWPEGDGKF